MNSKRDAPGKRVPLPRPFAYSRQFRKDFERYNRAGRSDMARLKTLMLLLIAADGPLDAVWRDHSIDQGEFAGTGMRDAHVHGDFLLLYRLTCAPETLIFERLGTHSELF